ncbi:hypothetical protein CYK23_04430 [Streptococcus salivarius]|nr:hypothetical protein CYK23_04430 [Streptococcus salivarius]
MADTRTKSDINLGRKGQAVADTRINRLTEWLTDSVSHFFFVRRVWQNKKSIRDRMMVKELSFSAF